MIPNSKHKKNERPLRLLVETGDGRSASALFENGFLRYCTDMGAEVHVLSPGACFKPFVDRYQLPGVKFTFLSVHKVSKIRFPLLSSFETRLGRRLCHYGLPGARRLLWQVLGERLVAADADYLNQFVDEVRPDCFVTAQLNLGFGRGMVAMCRRKGIPTVGNVFSWDHPFYPQQSRPDVLTCWSAEVRDGLVKIGGFLPKQIEVIGAPMFDPYFDPAGVWTRKELCDRMGLDPARPILLFATLGQMRKFWDETGTFRGFLAALDRAGLPGPPQVVLRLHPISVDHYFEEFRSRKDVVFSRYTGYCPGMQWWASRDEVILAGNLLRHADACISPGSTMTVEASIFDTPTILPLFNTDMPEDYERVFREDWLNKHFRFLVDEDTVALAKTPEELIAAIQKALGDRHWLATGRRKIREQLLGPLDGRATERLAQVVAKYALQHASAESAV